MTEGRRLQLLGKQNNRQKNNPALPAITQEPKAKAKAEPKAKRPRTPSKTRKADGDQGANATPPKTRAPSHTSTFVKGPCWTHQNHLINQGPKCQHSPCKFEHGAPMKRADFDQLATPDQKRARSASRNASEGKGHSDKGSGKGEGYFTIAEGRKS